MGPWPDARPAGEELRRDRRGLPVEPCRRPRQHGPLPPASEGLPDRGLGVPGRKRRVLPAHLHKPRRAGPGDQHSALARDPSARLLPARTTRRLDEAVANGYVATHADGTPYVFSSNINAERADRLHQPGRGALVAGPELRKALDLGADGFMQDFGEQVLADMHFHDGSTGATMHNRYPVALPPGDAPGGPALRAPAPEAPDLGSSPAPATPAARARPPTRAATSPATRRPTGPAPPASPRRPPTCSTARSAAPTASRTDIGGYFDVGPTRRRPRSCSSAGPSGRRCRRSSACTASVAAGTHTPWSYDDETVAIYKQLSQPAPAGRAADPAAVADGRTGPASRRRGRSGSPTPGDRRGRARRTRSGCSAATCSSRRWSRRAPPRAASTSRRLLAISRNGTALQGTYLEGRPGASECPALLLPVRQPSVQASGDRPNKLADPWRVVARNGSGPRYSSGALERGPLVFLKLRALLDSLTWRDVREHVQPHTRARGCQVAARIAVRLRLRPARQRHPGGGMHNALALHPHGHRRTGCMERLIDVALELGSSQRIARARPAAAARSAPRQRARAARRGGRARSRACSPRRWRSASSPPPSHPSARSRSGRWRRGRGRCRARPARRRRCLWGRCSRACRRPGR